MRTVPVRSAPGFAAARTVIVALPVPLDGLATVSHGPSLIAVHVQPFNVSSLTMSEPPETGTAALDGVTLKRQGAASCVSVICVLLTSRTARRTIASGFAST